jgi:hypothetical protein
MGTHEIHHHDHGHRRSKFDWWRGERPWPATHLPPGMHEEDEFHHEEPTVSSRFLKHEALVISGLVIGLLVIAMIVAIAVIPLTATAWLLVAALLAVYAAFLTAPVWLAAIVDDAEDFTRETEAEEPRQE